MHESDQEQLDAVKAWWKENGRMIIVLVVVAVVVSLGWRLWQQHRNVEASEASLLYEQMLIAADEGKTEDAKQAATSLVSHYTRTPYAALGGLMQAKLLVDAGNLAAADQSLDWVIKHSKSEAIRQIARVRAARVLLAKHQYADALAVLSTIDSQVYAPMISDVKGDIYAATGERAKAIAAYQEVLEASPPADSLRSFVQMKLTHIEAQ